MRFKFLEKFIFFITCITIMVASCKEEDSQEKEIAKINTDISIERFDRLFSNSKADDLPNLKKAYPFMFSEKYLDSFWIAKINDTLQHQLYEAVEKSIPNFDDVENEIENLFNHIKYYFPEFNPPRVITAISMVDYRNKVIVTDTVTLISTDTYLGDSHEFYEGLQKYIVKNLRKEQIIVDMASQYAMKYIYQAPRKTLLDEMIYYGKVLYFNDIMIPFKTEAERIGYTEEELEWAINNESYIWRYFVERELLYSTDSKLPNRFINPAPFTKFYLEEIDSDSPGRLGQYIGWQIVRAYMENNNISLKDMLNQNPKEIFDKSKFKPRK